MIKKIFLFSVFGIVFLLSSRTVFANEVRPGDTCYGGDVCCNSGSGPCVVDNSFQCLPDSTGTIKYGNGSIALICQSSGIGGIFGKIKPPPAIEQFIGKDETGAAGISKFLSNLIVLIYSLAGIVLLFMIIWGALEWMLSGGDKEKVASARGRIMNAFIGIILFAVAFAVIQIIGQFTGFKFFQGQGVRVFRIDNTLRFICPDGFVVDYAKPGDDPDIACKGHGT